MRTRQQIDPRALAIVEGLGVSVEEGRSPPELGNVPNFRGLPKGFWEQLYAEQPKLFRELEHICRADFPTYAALLLKVFNKQAGITHAFIFNNGQAIAWNALVKAMLEQETLFFIFLKARQLGISTIVSAWHHWHVWRGEEVATTMIGHEDSLAKRLIRGLGLFHEHLPDIGGLKPALREQRKGARIPKAELYYAEHRSGITTRVASSVEARGDSSKHFLLSEFAFYPEPQALLDALMPQLPPFGSPARLDCSVFVESSPNGQNFMYTLWQDAKSDKSEWHGIFLPWMIQDDMYSVEPPPHWKMTSEEREKQRQLSNERRKIDGKDVSRAQMYWRRHTIENEYSGDEEAFDMEYPSDDETCFQLRSETVFKGQMRMLTAQVAEAEIHARTELPKLGYASVGVLRGDLKFDDLASPFETQGFFRPKKPKFKTDPRGELLLWDLPREGHHYVCGGDSAGGYFQRDNAVAEVVDVTWGRQVAEFSAPVAPEYFADVMTNLCLLFNNALAMPEINGNGAVVMKRMMQNWMYANVAREEKWDEAGVKKHKYGFSTQENTKPILISNCVWMIQEGFVKIASRPLLSELSTFRHDGYTFNNNPMYSAKGKNHDDRVMAFALALIAVKQSPKLLTLMSGNGDRQVSAVDLGLNRAPVLPDNEKIPAAMLNVLDGRGDYEVPANPIRGYLDW